MDGIEKNAKRQPSVNKEKPINDVAKAPREKVKPTTDGDGQQAPAEKEKPLDEKLANKAGQVATRAAMDYATGGEYEKIRNKPVVGDVAKGVEKAGGDVVEKGVKTTKKVKKIALITTILISFLSIFLVILPVIILIIIIGSTSNNVAINGYYPSQCQEITVIFTDKKNNYEEIGVKTYPLEEYVAGVVAGEVGFLGNIEVDKEFAIAARSYGLSHVNNCTIESSDRRQVFRELTDSPTDQLARQAAEETKGQVLLVDNNLFGVQYDAFCSIAVDANYYTIKQANQKIPRSWADSQRGIAESWKQGTCAGNHGNGLSQWGSLYLASEMNYDYKEILSFYLKDYDFVISSGFISSIAGLEVKNTTNAKNLLEIPIEEFLTSNGSSLAQYNDFINESVNNIGYGTREGVVAAAVSAINFLYDNFDAKLPYYWGGAAQSGKGIPSYFGTYKPSIPSRSNTVYYYQSFDCSGFVSWAIKNGGYNFPRITASGFLQRFSSDSCDIMDSNCIGQPGDLICSSGHVQLIVATDETSGKYIIAESGPGVVMGETNMHAQHSYGHTRILHLDSFYNNQANVSSSQ